MSTTNVQIMESVNKASNDVKIDTTVPNEIQKTEECNVKPQVITEDVKEKEKPAKEKKSGKEEKSKKKDDRTVEQILKNLGCYETAEEKLNALCKKYLEVLDDNRKNAVALKQIDKRITIMQRQNEQVTAEKNKALLAKSRLENLCRELQKQNKAVKEEIMLKVKEEEEKRKEASAKFQTTLTDITALMAEANEKNDKLYEDNIEMEAKFRALLEETILREQRFENMKQMMEHELLLAKGTLAKITIEMSEEKEALLKDKTTLLHKLSQYQDRIQELQTTEANLRSQLAIYTDKYNEFQNALHKSNEVFGGFNQEMEKMSKKSLKLEKESLHWKSRWEKGQAALLEMATDKQTRDAEFATLNKKFLKLQELCKTFQQERAMLMAQLKQWESGNLGIPIFDGNANANANANANTNATANANANVNANTNANVNVNANSNAIANNNQTSPPKRNGTLVIDMVSPTTCRRSKPVAEVNKTSIKKNSKDTAVDLGKAVSNDNKEEGSTPNPESQKNHNAVQNDGTECPIKNLPTEVQANDPNQNKTDLLSFEFFDQPNKASSSHNNNLDTETTSEDKSILKQLHEIVGNKKLDHQNTEASVADEKLVQQNLNKNLSDENPQVPNGDEKCGVPEDESVQVKVGILTET